MLHDKGCGNMKASDIKIGHIYYVNYDPVQQGEFDGKHLSVVLKRNNDKYTFIVMPLTSSSNGDGVNKVNIGKIIGLPIALRNKDSYAVFDQVRTVNANRFINVKYGNSNITALIDKKSWLYLFELTVRDTFYNINQDDRIITIKRVYDRECFEKAKNLAYKTIKLRKLVMKNEKMINNLLNEIKITLKDINYILDPKQKADGIEDIINEALSIK